MENTAQESEISRRTRGTRCNRTLRAPKRTRAKASSAAPTAQRRAWLAKLDKAANQNDRAMLFWLDVAARYYTDPVHDVLVAMKTVERPASDHTGLPALYVWEVAWRRESGDVKWQFIVWDVSGYGVRFLDWEGRSEAMALYNLPAEQGIAAVQHAPGVYLRADARHRKVSPAFM